MQRCTSFVAAGLLAVGLWLTMPASLSAQGQLAATPPQLKACRSEADRRLADYTYDQIQVVSEGRDQNVADVRWSAGNDSGLCTVATNGRILAFTRDASYGGTTPGTTRVTCESRRGDRQECHVPSGSRIRLLRQLSENPCRANDTYGQGPGYIWVAEGCRGEFEVTLPGGGGPGGVTRITCASPTNTRQECRIPTGDQARYVAQAGSRPCRVNDTYGWTRGGVWVDLGCQAIFELTGSGGYPGGGSYTTRMTCESQTAARQQCPIAGATQIRLARQLSTNPCRLNDSYGIGFGYIWVSSGCRGEFDVTVSGAPGSGTGVPTNDTGLPSSSGLPDRLTCESKNLERAECRIRDGAPQVQLIRQLSSAACTRYITWGLKPGVLWVDKGCRGEFEVR
jgi:hypothetical protein